MSRSPLIADVLKSLKSFLEMFIKIIKNTTTSINNPLRLIFIVVKSSLYSRRGVLEYLLSTNESTSAYSPQAASQIQTMTTKIVINRHSCKYVSEKYIAGYRMEYKSWLLFSPAIFFLKSTDIFFYGFGVLCQPFSVVVFFTLYVHKSSENWRNLILVLNIDLFG